MSRPNRPRSGSGPVDASPYERQYRKLRRELAGIGYLMKGSLQVRRTLCGYAACRCHTGGRFRHGPYYWWTSKIGGKTVTVVLPEAEGKLFVAWAKNRRQLQAILKKMYRVSAHVAGATLGRPPPWIR